jgi:predicted dehydrogenase
MSKQRVGFGVIGAGGIARRKTIPALLKAQHCDVVAVMNPSRVDQIAAEFGIAKAFVSDAELLDDPAVEAVYIASPVFCHAEQIERAARAGKHILCEKPLTLNLQQAEEAVAVCQRNGVFLQEGYMMKFHNAHVKIKQMIDAGQLGKIVSLRAQLACWYPRIEAAWRQDPRLGGGGALIDMATHLYDLLESFAGPIRRVIALTSTLVQDYPVEDAATSLLEFESGAHATVDCFFCIPDAASRTRLEIYGSRGAVLTEGTIGQSERGQIEALLDIDPAPYDAAQDKDVVRAFAPVDFEPVNPFTAQCDYFARCILQGRAPAINNAANALHILDLAEKAYASYRTGHLLEIQARRASE